MTMPEQDMTMMEDIESENILDDSAIEPQIDLSSSKYDKFKLSFLHAFYFTFSCLRQGGSKQAYNQQYWLESYRPPDSYEKDQKTSDRNQPSLKAAVDAE